MKEATAMKSSYEARAIKFAHVLANMFEDCIDLYDFENVIYNYNLTHSRKIKYAHGVSRIAIIRADYVIKFNMYPEEDFEDGRAGNNMSESAVYERAVKAGMAHLLAKPTIIKINNQVISIMPRINGIDNWEREWYNYCTEEEADWLDENVCDLHEGNVGYRHGKVCVVDYAWDRDM
jgi:hypothetical protein